MKYTIVYYSDRVEKQILGLPRTLSMRYLKLTELMVDYGGDLGMPHTKSLGDGIFELRLKGQEGIARVCYCTLVGQRIVMLHSFIKKTDKTPHKELDIARKRKEELQNA